MVVTYVTWHYNLVSIDNFKYWIVTKISGVIFVGKIGQIRIFLYILVLILMVSLVWYDNKAPRNVESGSSLKNYLKNPEKYGGDQF